MKQCFDRKNKKQIGFVAIPHCRVAIPQASVELICKFCTGEKPITGTTFYPISYCALHKVIEKR